ncbi:calmodulin-binding protein 60 B-like isoform X2 [Phragmites australis]|uniref:calmodulin-binding protein 60 B-like isoform X2 n=1 Tax=Phragmites australis TaxID=29695 RepID=UPI002D764FBB|nr:calmodulin-binding protein 60 B-like isoform X2 [Phragmites australis]
MAPKRQLLVAAGGDGAVLTPGKRLRVTPATGSSLGTPSSSPRKSFLAIVLVILFFKRPKGRCLDVPSQIGRLVSELGQVRRCFNTIARQQEIITELIQDLTQKVDNMTRSSPNHHNHEQLTQEANQERISVQSDVLATNQGEGKSSNIRLRFLNGIKTPVYHDDKIKPESDGAIKIGIFDGDKMIKSGPLSKAKVEILALEGNFPYDALDSWTDKEFNEHIARGRDGKGNVLVGKGTTARLINGERDLGSIKFREGSCKARNGMFFIGARVCEGQPTGVRVQQAVMTPVVVQDRRNKSNEKSHPPKLNDRVHRLEKIAKDGKYFERLAKKNIHTVEDFLKALNKDPDNLAKILKINKEHEAWEKMIGHASNCCLEGKHKLKSYTCAEKNVKLFFNCVHRLVGAAFSGGRYTPADKFNQAEQESVAELKEDAYAELDVLPEDHVMADNFSEPIHMDTYVGFGAGPSYMPNATQPNCPGHLAAHQVGGIPAVEDLSHAEIESSCADANNDPGPSFSIPDQGQGARLLVQEHLSLASLNGWCQGPLGGTNSSIGTSEELCFQEYHTDYGAPILCGLDHLETQVGFLWQGIDTFEASTSAHRNMTLAPQQLATTGSAQGSMQSQLQVPLPPNNGATEASASALYLRTVTGAPGLAQGSMQSQMQAPLPPSNGALEASTSAYRTLPQQQWNMSWNRSL